MKKLDKEIEKLEQGTKTLERLDALILETDKLLEQGTKTLERLDALILETDKLLERLDTLALESKKTKELIKKILLD